MRHSANQSENDGLREDNEKLRRKISKLQTANERLGDKILELSAAEKNARQRMEAESKKRRDAQEEAPRLQEVLAQIEEELAKAQDRLTKSSSNSSKPPSSDPYGVASKKKKESKAERDALVTDAVDSEQKEKSPNEYNTRRRSGKKPGGQLGHTLNSRKNFNLPSKKCQYNARDFAGEQRNCHAGGIALAPEIEAQTKQPERSVFFSADSVLLTCSSYKTTLWNN